MRFCYTHFSIQSYAGGLQELGAGHARAAAVLGAAVQHDRALAEVLHVGGEAVVPGLDALLQEDAPQLGRQVPNLAGRDIVGQVAGLNAAGLGAHQLAEASLAGELGCGPAAECWVVVVAGEVQAALAQRGGALDGGGPALVDVPVELAGGAQPLLVELVEARVPYVGGLVIALGGPDLAAEQRGVEGGSNAVQRRAVYPTAVVAVAVVSVAGVPLIGWAPHSVVLAHLGAAFGAGGSHGGDHQGYSYHSQQQADGQRRHCWAGNVLAGAGRRVSGAGWWWWCVIGGLGRWVRQMGAEGVCWFAEARTLVSCRGESSFGTA
mmetsp:Transcript_6080/g.16947  ORF Transcript_6080/g.16947 Transcript_6080/m.16947 type:complete len:321 (+) Transcript_6080:166-1128(+)